ncbi:MAG: hypothetical protein Q9220_002254 [cf. Caloplaca sp. 1 TL-2023]
MDPSRYRLAPYESEISFAQGTPLIVNDNVAESILGNCVDDCQCSACSSRESLSEPPEDSFFDPQLEEPSFDSQYQYHMYDESDREGDTLEFKEETNRFQFSNGESGFVDDTAGFNDDTGIEYDFAEFERETEIQTDIETDYESEPEETHIATRKANSMKSITQLPRKMAERSRRATDAPKVSKLRAKILRLASEGRELDPNGTLKGETKIRNGRLLYLDKEDWIPAVYHEELRARLLRTTRLEGSYDEKPTQGFHRLDRTSYLPAQKSWKFQNRSERPDVLFVWNRQFVYHGYQPESWFDEGRIVLSQENRPIKMWNELPATISAQCEGLRMEAWRRINPNITMNDIKARMPRLTQKRICLAEKVVKTTALANRMQRDRIFTVAKAWCAREGSCIKETRTLSLLSPEIQGEIIRTNSTRCVERDMTRTEVYYIEEGNRGTAISLAKAGARRLNAVARQGNRDKSRPKKFEELEVFDVIKEAAAAVEECKYKPKNDIRPYQARTTVVRKPADRGPNQVDGQMKRFLDDTEDEGDVKEELPRKRSLDDSEDEDDVQAEPPRKRTLDDTEVEEAVEENPRKRSKHDVEKAKPKPKSFKRSKYDAVEKPAPKPKTFRRRIQDYRPVATINSPLPTMNTPLPRPPTGVDMNGHYTYHNPPPPPFMHAPGHRALDASHFGMQSAHQPYPRFEPYAPTAQGNAMAAASYGHPLAFPPLAAVGHYHLGTNHLPPIPLIPDAENYRQGANQGLETAEDWANEVILDRNGMPIPGYGGLNENAYWYGPEGSIAREE